MSDSNEQVDPTTTTPVVAELPVVRENYQEEIAVEEDKKAVDAEETAAPAAENTDEMKAQADEQFDELFAEDSQEEFVEEDGPTGETATGSNEPKSSDSALKEGLYDPAVARAAKEKAARHAMDADGKKTTAIVEQSNALEAGGDEIQMDDLAWLNEEDDLDLDMDDLFPKDLNIEEELALEDGTVSGNLAIGDTGIGQAPMEEQEDKKPLNAFESGLERLKRKRPKQEMTAQEAENLMEDLICKMTTAADEDAEIIRKNMAKDRLADMCNKAEQAARKKQAYLGKKEHNSRFQRLYKFAKFPTGKEALRSYFDEDEKFSPAKALKGTRDLLKKNPVQPAMAKVCILKHCITEMNKPTNADWFVTFGGLSVVRTWLIPNPDGTLPALSLRNELLKVLEKLPVTTSNLKKSKLGVTLKELVRRNDETLNNRKLIKELINKWLAQVLDQETSIRRHRAQEQYESSQQVKHVEKKRKTKKEMAAENKEIQERRHPQMFQKANNVFLVQPSYDVSDQSRKNRDESRKGKVGKIAGELRAIKPPQKHANVCISANGIHLDF